MADPVDKRRTAAFEMMGAVNALLGAVETAATLASSISQAGLTFIDSDFEGSEASGLHHITAATMDAVLAELDYTDPDSFVYAMIASGSSVTLNMLRS